ncbi:hydroxyacylglutathione hydrolase [Rhodocyclus tenuis]|uniref:hydroxyacylglutathione hydrolase n=1 Tax=Rhodocyclus tenuis TaxID=1066 RepID=UPI0019036BF0|nr:hydroxyacylglutathione hydrolase [Rhodocyclus tenuis]MBK1679174.1 hydroxyacylglutathione hydrolase [Rhodocyclus tenuis]
MLKPSAFPVLSVDPAPIAIPAFADNYIWLLRQGSSALVVDPGDAAPVLAFLRREGLRLAAILVTHHHADHQGGIAGLLAASREAGVEPAVFGPAAESITALSEPLRGGETIRSEAMGIDFRVLAVPGHTRGHLAYYRPGQLFCGDTLFGAGCGRLFEGTASQMAASLATLAALPDATGVYCAHEYTAANLRFAAVVEPGNACVQERIAEVTALRAAGQASVPSSLALEKASNPFLRCGEPEVIDSVLRWCAQSATPLPERDDPVAVFAALRAWKNVF